MASDNPVTSVFDGRTGHVLVVDDTPEIATPLAMSLAAAGYRVTLAEDGAEALDHIRTETPDLVLLDLMMPFVDGWKVLSRLRTWEHGSPPVIVVSALGSSSEKLLAQMMGAVDYVTKPFDMEDLVERVNSIMARAAVESA